MTDFERYLTIRELSLMLGCFLAFTSIYALVTVSTFAEGSEWLQTLFRLVCGSGGVVCAFLTGYLAMRLIRTPG